MDEKEEQMPLSHRRCLDMIIRRLKRINNFQ